MVEVINWSCSPEDDQVVTSHFFQCNSTRMILHALLKEINYSMESHVHCHGFVEECRRCESLMRFLYLFIPIVYRNKNKTSTLSLVVVWRVHTRMPPRTVTLHSRCFFTIGLSKKMFKNHNVKFLMSQFKALQSNITDMNKRKWFYTVLSFPFATTTAFFKETWNKYFFLFISGRNSHSTAAMQDTAEFSGDCRQGSSKTGSLSSPHHWVVRIQHKRLYVLHITCSSNLVCFTCPFSFNCFQ